MSDEYQCCLDACQEFASQCGCPDDYVQDEQRWQFLFKNGYTPDAAVQEDLKENSD